MRLTIELCAGPMGHSPTKSDIAKNIAAIDRAIKGQPLASDYVLMMDTKSILDGIKDLLPE